MNIHSYLILTHLLRPHVTTHENPLITAYFGLAGVVIGGLLSGGISLGLASWQSSRQVHQERKLLADKLKIAARLLDYDIRMAKRAVQVFVNSHQTAADIHFLHVDLPSWDAHKEVIAMCVSPDLWSKLTKASVSANFLEALIHSPAMVQAVPIHMRVDSAKDVVTALDDALEILTPYAN
jgi:hypothetical protein